MTWITDENGTRWVEPEPRKPPRKARAVRFADIKVGSQLKRVTPTYDKRRTIRYYIVTDLWFDPVRGQKNPALGEMVGFAPIMPNGVVLSTKSSFSKVALAGQQFHYSEIDYIELCLARKGNDKVVGIGRGHTLRKRPKLPGKPL